MTRWVRGAGRRGMRSRLRLILCAVGLLLVVTGCRPLMQSHFADARSPGHLEMSSALDDLATAHSLAMCDAGSVLHTEDPVDAYGDAGDLAVRELVGVAALDMGITKAPERLRAATDAIWAQWHDDPVATDPAYDVLGVGYEMCGSDLYYTAVLIDRPGPWPAERVELPTLGGSHGTAEGVSESGFVVGMSTLAGDDAFHAYRWAWPEGAVTDLGTLGGADSIAYDVNEGGTVVGSSTLADGQVHAFVVQPGGTIESLGTLGGTQSAAYAVNDAGVVVGTSMLSGDGASVAYRWDPAIAEMEALPGLSTEYSVAHDVNDAGEVVGETLLDDGRMAGFAWSPDSGTRIIDDGATSTGLLAVDERGIAVGDASGADAAARQPGVALAGTADEVVPISIGLGGDATAYASNEDLVVVGQSGIVPAREREFDPDQLPIHVGFIRTSNGQVLTPEGTLTNSIYTDVSRAVAVGSVSVADGESRAVVQPLTALAPTKSGPLALVPLSGAAVAAVSPLAMAAVVLVRRRRGRAACATAPERLAHRWTVLGLVGAVVVSTAVVVGPSVVPAAAQTTPCAAEQEVLDNQLAYLAEMQAALASGPSEAAVETAHNIKDGAFDRLHDELNHRNAIQARVAAFEGKIGSWHQWFDPAPPESSSTQMLLGPIKEFVDGEITDAAIDGAQKYATYLADAHPEQLPGALNRGLVQAGLREAEHVVTLAEPIGNVAGGVGIGLAAIQISYAIGGLLAGTQLAVEGQALLDDISARPPATLDQLAQLSTVYNQNLDLWAQLSVEREANEAKVDQAKALVKDALGLLNQCREVNGLDPITLPAELLPTEQPEAGGNGEPHMTTFDGLKYDFQAEGEFWMVRSPVDDFGVQIRTTHGTPASAPYWAPGRVAWIDGAGVVTPGGHEVMYEPGRLLIDGAAPARLPTVLDDGTYVQQVNPYRVELTLTDGTFVSAFFAPPDQGPWFSGVNVKLADGRRGAVEGLLGDADGSPDGDGKSAAGDVVFGPGTLAEPGAEDLLYEDFGPSWLVDAADRAFTGEVRSYRLPESFQPDELSFPQAEIDAVHGQCVAHGLAVAPALDWCVFDSLVTGVHPDDLDPALTDAWAESVVRDGFGVEADGAPPALVDAGNSPRLTVLRGATALAAGVSHACAVVDGQVLCWGSNGQGQLGDGTRTSRLTPVPTVGINEPVIEVSVGGSNTCARTASGAAWCWGDNSLGQIGNGTTSFQPTLTPTRVVGLPEPVRQIVSGDGQTCAVTTSGGVWCWGQNLNGKLGDGTTIFRSAPVAVVGLPESIAQIDASYSHTCAVGISGAAWCWGANTAGALGDGTTTNRPTPVRVTGLPGPIAAISAGDAHTCVRLVAGEAWCWGQNTNGRLGDGTTTNRSSPVRVVDLPGPIDVIDADSSSHTCALTASGAAWCWGHNLQGELGDGTTTNRSRPVAVTALSETVSNIEPGLYFTCALTPEGEVWCWGNNADGELGDGTTTLRPTPVQVMLPS